MGWTGRRPGRHSGGFTLLEVLLAVAIFGIAFMALGFALFNNLVGVRDDYRVAVSNQVAVSRLEELRTNILTSPTNFDGGYANTQSVTVGRETYSVQATVSARNINGSGDISGGAAVGKPDLYLVDLRVQWPGGIAREYSALVRRVL